MNSQNEQPVTVRRLLLALAISIGIIVAVGLLGGGCANTITPPVAKPERERPSF